MPSTRDKSENKISPFKRILAVGATGSGKTTQVWTLPGRKFAYVFDPNTIPNWVGIAEQLGIDPPEIDYEIFKPDLLNMDSTLKGFRQTAKDDSPEMIGRHKKEAEPIVYMDFIEDINRRVEENFFEPYDWLIFESLTFLNKATMARNLWINNHYGFIEDLADYRVVGSKISELFTSLTSLDINIYMSAHWQSFQDEKTKKIDTQITAYGNSRRMIPLIFTDVWQLLRAEDGGYDIRTKPDARGLQDLRSSIVDLKELEDVTITDFSKAEEFGIGAILTEHGWKPKGSSAPAGKTASKLKK